MVGSDLFYTNFKYHQRNHLFIQVWTNSQVLKETFISTTLLSCSQLKSILSWLEIFRNSFI